MNALRSPCPLFLPLPPPSRFQQAVPNRGLFSLIHCLSKLLLLSFLSLLVLFSPLLPVVVAYTLAVE